MRWLRFLGGSRRRRSPFNNLDASGSLTCGQVTTQLFVGGELGPRDWEALQEQGVSVVVNLQHEQQDVWSPEESINGYLWLPAPDGMAPSLGQLTQGVSFIRAAVRSGQKVFVHCKAGQGRAPLLCACYLIGEGAAPLEAIKKVREARPRTLLTPDQSARLREFAAHFAPDDASLPGSPAAQRTSNISQSTSIEASAGENANNGVLHTPVNPAPSSP
jgi:atypical dual specificity phosphatase